MPVTPFSIDDDSAITIPCLRRESITNIKRLRRVTRQFESRFRHFFQISPQSLRKRLDLRTKRQKKFSYLLFCIIHLCRNDSTANMTDESFVRYCGETRTLSKETLLYVYELTAIKLATPSNN